MTKLQKVQQRLGVWNHTKLPEGTQRQDRIGRGIIDRYGVESKEDRSDMDETKEDDEPKENGDDNAETAVPPAKRQKTSTFARTVGCMATHKVSRRYTT